MGEPFVTREYSDTEARFEMWQAVLVWGGAAIDEATGRLTVTARQIADCEVEANDQLALAGNESRVVTDRAQLLNTASYTTPDVADSEQSSELLDRVRMFFSVARSSLRISASVATSIGEDLPTAVSSDPESFLQLVELFTDNTNGYDDTSIYDRSNDELLGFAQAAILGDSSGQMSARLSMPFQTKDTTHNAYSKEQLVAAELYRKLGKFVAEIYTISDASGVEIFGLSAAQKGSIAIEAYKQWVTFMKLWAENGGRSRFQQHLSGQKVVRERVLLHKNPDQISRLLTVATKYGLSSEDVMGHIVSASVREAAGYCYNDLSRLLNIQGGVTVLTKREREIRKQAAALKEERVGFSPEAEPGAVIAFSKDKRMYEICLGTAQSLIDLVEQSYGETASKHLWKDWRKPATINTLRPSAHTSRGKKSGEFNGQVNNRCALLLPVDEESVEDYFSELAEGDVIEPAYVRRVLFVADMHSTGRGNLGKSAIEAVLCVVNPADTIRRRIELSIRGKNAGDDIARLLRLNSNAVAYVVQSGNTQSPPILSRMRD